MLNCGIAIAVGGLVVAAAMQAAQSGDLAEPVHNVSAEVTLTPAAAGGAVGDASQVVVWLVPEDAASPVRMAASNSESARYKIVQHNKGFEPHLLVVPVGSSVDFPNLDPWFHNVFSLYRGKRFDLGLYQAGSQRSVRFDRPGPSYLFCNIHAEMTAVVLAIESPFFGVSDKTGHVTIRNVPPGKYMLRVWYEHAPAEVLQSLRRPVVVNGEGHALSSIRIPVGKREHLKHKNKFGQEYDPKAPAADY